MTQNCGPDRNFAILKDCSYDPIGTDTKHEFDRTNIELTTKLLLIYNITNHMKSEYNNWYICMYVCGFH